MSELINTVWAGHFGGLGGLFDFRRGGLLRALRPAACWGLFGQVISSGLGLAFQFPKSVVQASEPIVLLAQPVEHIVVDTGFHAVAVALHPVLLFVGERWRHVHFQVGEAMPDGLFNSLGVEICELFPYEIKKTWSTTTRT